MIRKGIVALSAAFILASCSSVALTGRKQLLLVSDAEVLSLSQSNFQDYMKTARPSTQTTNTQMVKRVGSKIARAVEQYLTENGQAAEVNNFAWEFHLVQDQTPNAFCMPGGKIVINEGILPYTQTEEGLAIVVGHEVAHAVAKHSAERLSHQMLASYGGQVLSGALGGQSAATRALAQQVFGLGAQYGVMLPYSRKNEYEADHLGMVFSAMAGYNPEAALSFWQRMSALSGGGSSTPAFMSTHPSDEARIRNIQKLMPEAMQYYRAAKPSASPITKPATKAKTSSGQTTKKRSFSLEPVKK